MSKSARFGLSFLIFSFLSSFVIAEKPVTYAYFDWGNPLFSDGDFSLAPRPSWVLFSYKVEGEWITEPPSGWHVPAQDQSSTAVGHLVTEIDRELMNADVRFVIKYHNLANSFLSISLLDTNGVAVIDDIGGNLCETGSGDIVSRDVLLPLKANSDAWIVSVRASGPVVVFESLLCLPEAFDLNADALLALARFEFNERLTTSTSTGETVSDSSVISDVRSTEKTAADELKKELERRGQRADTNGRVNLRVFTVME